MSDMLEQAIIDAEALKEAALKNAEKIIVEKYSNEIKEAVDVLLEQPEEDPLVSDEDTDENVPDLPEAPEDSEEIDLSEEQISEILEKLTIDIKSVPTGQAGGASNETLEKEMKDILVAEEEQEEEVSEEEKPIPSAREKELGQQVESLSLENKKFKDMLLQLKDKLEEVNLSNAKLLYTNRVLESASLNERQRKRIVEALSNADSVEEAKVIYETLQSAVGSKRKQAPKSLNEVVQRSSTTIPRRKEENKANPLSDRWKTLAGIK